MKANRGKVDAHELVSLAVTGYEALGRPGRETVLVEQELLLYAARHPALSGPYLAYVDECLRQFAVLLEDAMRYTRLEFTCDFGEAIELLRAAHTHMHLQSLFTQTMDTQILHGLLAAITRPLPDSVGD